MPKITKELLQKELLDGKSIREISKDNNVSFACTYKWVKRYGIPLPETIWKTCIYCNNAFQAIRTHGNHLRQKYCSGVCRQADWIKTHPERWSEYQRTQRLKRPVLCKFCNKEIPKDIRKSGLVFCSDECRNSKQKLDAKKFRSKASKKFSSYKISIGCLKCGYNKHGGSLDFHHFNPDDKEKRIAAAEWVLQTESILKELKKCILVCKNCHYELHDLYLTNKDKYWLKINKLLQSGTE